MGLRKLVLVLADQLDPRSPALEDFDADSDLLWMAELREESEHVWSHKARTALFFSAMRHFADRLRERGIPVRYLRIGAHPFTGFGDALAATISAERPQRLVVVEPGDHRVLTRLSEAALQDFVEHRLPAFGPYQDALWSGETYLYHSRLSAAMNLGLLSPRAAVDAAVAAYRSGAAPLASVEGFVRQIIGWRELVRGLYWTRMPGYLDMNSVNAHQPLPGFYWTGETDMRCLAETIGQTLEYGYAHHIQRLMVTGLFALILGVEPRQVHAWYLAVYVDAIEWVELPNVLGMSQFADGGVMGSKPYVASGKYIQRMSNYCGQCRYNPAEATGESACPFTTLYWDFLMRHEARFRDQPRAGLQWRNLDRPDEEKRAAIRRRAEWLYSVSFLSTSM
jgi:deoxyribodipyrimidine photolyase-related protein